MVEFAIVAAVLFLLLFGVFEIGRFFWTLNTLNEMTRRGARLAAVCPIDHPDVARVAVYNNPGDGSTSPILNNLTAANIDVRYLDVDGVATASYTLAEFVAVSITNYPHTLLIPFISADVATIQMPPVTATLPTESLGYIPDFDSRQCFGT
jgi:hypothetical protein